MKVAYLIIIHVIIYFIVFREDYLHEKKISRCASHPLEH